MTSQKAKNFLKDLAEEYYSPGGEILIPLIERAQEVLSPELDKAEARMKALVAQYEAADNEELYDSMVEAVEAHKALYDLFLI